LFLASSVGCQLCMLLHKLGNGSCSALKGLGGQ